MKWWKLKFTYSVELGASLAYKGHFKRTGDLNIHNIYLDEIDHRDTLIMYIVANHHDPSEFLEAIFLTIGTTVGFLCKIMPTFLLDKVASLLEIFAIYSYYDLAKEFPEYSNTFIEMAETEERHREYFSRV
jgi:hypothetical protein